MNNPFELEIITTTDGSHTLKLIGHDEQYHSRNGAVGESMHVFIRSGFDALPSSVDPVHVLEIGLGTGLNALLTAQRAIQNKRKVLYHAIEPYPLSLSVLNQLNYAGLIDREGMNDEFNKIHSSDHLDYNQVSAYFLMKIFRTKVQEMQWNGPEYDLVYFDAFGPDTQPEMWTQEIFNQMFSIMRANGILVTYCAKGAVKRALKSVGFRVENLPGPPGKREITRAFKP